MSISVADRLTASPSGVLEAVRAITAQPIDDGLVFYDDEARAEIIRDEEEYNGVRVTMTVELASARMAFHVDVNVGDPVVPTPGRVELPRLRGGTVTLLGYPLAMVWAEKIVTMLERGEVNTRWRDFADVYLLAARHDADGDEPMAALDAVAKYRGVRLRGLLPDLEALPGTGPAPMGCLGTQTAPGRPPSPVLPGDSLRRIAFRRSGIDQ